MLHKWIVSGAGWVLLGVWAEDLLDVVCLSSTEIATREVGACSFRTSNGWYEPVVGSQVAGLSLLTPWIEQDCYLVTAVSAVCIDH